MKAYWALVLALLAPVPIVQAADDKPAKKKDADSPQVERMVQSFLERFDTNKDGRISKEEAKGKLAENFDRLDANKDGYLDKEELQRAARLVLANRAKGEGNKPAEKKNPPALSAGKDFDALDRNADGRLSREEVKGTEIADHFDEIDTNKDGGIDKKEFKIYLRKKAEKATEAPSKK
ncbi:MAG: EF-hand domain-containing protein [Gemmataceae bacterium]